MPDGEGFKLVEPNLYDAQIVPDQGSINPFVPPGGPGGTYTVVERSRFAAEKIKIVYNSCKCPIPDTYKKGVYHDTC